MYLGIDFGTSGSRAVVIDSAQAIQAAVNVAIEQPTNWQLWRSSLFDLIAQIPSTLRQQIQAIAINGTSSTVLICDETGEPLTEPLLYNDARAASVLDRLRSIAPADHTVISATSSLAKLLWYLREAAIDPTPYFLHQADWLSFLLHGKLGITDYHNALKLGYDVGELRYPDWFPDLPIRLPQVVAPGTAIAPVQPRLIDCFGFPADCRICAGTTDSIAAFLASGATLPGEAVTSIGSTLVLKLLSETRVENARYGIYSHRYGDRWLVGGASNTGGAVLRQFFTDAELESLSGQIAIDTPSPLDYYPLLQPGDRFPINDASLPPRLEPRPVDRVEFLHGLLQGIAQIEARGYQLLMELGATPLRSIHTAGGGAKNAVWMQMRSRLLNVPVRRSLQTEAAFGTALLAMQSSQSQC